MWPRDLIAFATITTTLSAGLTRAASVGTQLADYEILNEADDKSSNDGPQRVRSSVDSREVRCYCNQPECVPQGYMCRGKGCFTELPFGANPSALLVRPEHSANNGCLKESFKDKQCPPGLLCCEQDLCNHVDSPAMISRLNKTLQGDKKDCAVCSDRKTPGKRRQTHTYCDTCTRKPGLHIVLVGDQRAFLGPIQPTGPTSRSTDGWFRTATIAVPICGLVVLLILASLAIRLLQPLPTQGDKLGPHRTPDNAPPLLGPPKVPLV